MKFHIVLIGLLIATVAPESDEREEGDGYTCRNLELRNCINNTRIQISKNSRDYQIRLCPSEQQCTAAAGRSLNWIRCSDICGACESLLGRNRENVKDSH